MIVNSLSILNAVYNPRNDIYIKDRNVFLVGEKAAGKMMIVKWCCYSGHMGTSGKASTPPQMFPGNKLPPPISGFSEVKNPAKAGRCGFHLWVGKIPWRRKWQSTPEFLPGEIHGQRSLVSYSPWTHKELDTSEWLTFTFFPFLISNCFYLPFGN